MAEDNTNSLDRQTTQFFTTHCTSCHGGDEPEADFSLQSLIDTADVPKHAEKWEKVLEQLQLREMPPEDEPQPSAHARADVVSRLTRQLRLAGYGTDLERKMRDFAYGNYVDHDALFQSKLEVAIPAEPRLWRLSPSIYEELVDDVGGDGVAQPFSFGPGHGLKDYASSYAIGEPAVVQLLRNAGEIVNNQTRDKYDKKTGKTIVMGSAARPIRDLVETNDEPTDEHITDALRYQFNRVLQRDPTDDELAGFTSLMRKNLADAGRVGGVRATLMAVLMMPEAVFRMELGQGEPDEHGRILLSPRELAYAISYALTDERPDGTLMKAFTSTTRERVGSNGPVQNKDTLAGASSLYKQTIAEQVKRLWNDPKKKRTRVLRFFREYFDYHRAVDIFKDDKDIKDFNGRFRAAILVHDTDQLVEWVLEKDQDVLRELLTTNKSFVNAKYDTKKRRYVMAHDKNQMNLAYNVPTDKWSSKQPMDLPRDERAGILTQPSWLVAHSDNLHTHPIFRGKWVRERLLGGTVPDLPITVDAQFPDAPEQTIRQRLSMTKEQYCWKCHQKMNPLGLPFEQFSHLGLYRRREEVLDVEATAANVDKKGQPQGPVMTDVPVDSTGAIAGSGDAKLDGDVKSAVEMIHRLAESERVRQVFVRHAFRYFLGRNEQLGDGPALIAADKAYVESGGSFKALVVALLTSDSFIYRKTPSTNQQTASARRD